MQTTLESWNLALFGWINAGTTAPVFLKELAVFAADDLIYLLVVWMPVYWVRGSAAVRTGLIVASLSALLGLGINQLIGLFWYHPRPFEMGVGNTLVPHALESSFPSDHGVIFFSIALILGWITATRRRGSVIMVLGLLVAWSRVYVGVHFPFDMVGACDVALLASAILCWAVPVVDSTLEPFFSRLYENIVKALHLPARWFPDT